MLTDAHRYIALGLATLGLCSPSVAVADAATDAPITLETEQVTATRSVRDVSDVAAAVTVVDERDILRQAPQTLPEIFRGQIGTYFQQTTPGQGTVILRGLKGSQVLHLVDGMRLNNAFFRSAPNQYLALVDPYSVARTEVVRGPASTLYGADAMGGVVQVLTREPAYRGSEWDTESGVLAGVDSAEARANDTRALPRRSCRVRIRRGGNLAGIRQPANRFG